MPWLQLRLSASPNTADALCDALTDAGAQAVTLRDAADTPIFEPGPDETPVWQHTWVIGMFNADVDMNAVELSLVKQFGKQVLENCSINPLEDKDWEREWMDNYHPMQFGEHLWICPSWREPPAPQAVNILLDPGLAFGTGTHATTALCLQWLDGHAPSGLEVIDYGCGSGILAIAAARLGAHHVQAVDHDPQAIIACRHNAEQNGVTDKISCCLPQAFERQPADLLLANILAAPLIELAPLFATLVHAGGHIVLSGILMEQAADIIQTYTPWFKIAEPISREGWVLVEGVRRTS